MVLSELSGGNNTGTIINGESSFIEHMLEGDMFDTMQTIVSVENELIINNILPGLSLDEPTALLLDANNLYRRAKENNFRIDYGKLSTIFSSRCNLQYRGVFTAVDRDYPTATEWVNYMSERGYTVVDKDLKKYTNSLGQSVRKGNMDIEMTIAAMSLPEKFTHVILGTCDADFVPLIEKLTEGRMKKVSVLGLHNAKGTGMPEDLIKEAERSSGHFYDMGRLIDFISYKRDRP